jgi:protein-disulfide isomerase-like protein with CxxC motif
VPAGTIKHHDHVVGRVTGRDFVKEYLHTL